MASTVNADNGSVSGSAGLKTVADSSGVLALQTNGTTAVTIGTDQNVVFNSTGSLTLPVGTTAQRPGTPANGMTRINTTANTLEVYSTYTGSWNTISTFIATYSVEFLVIAGGGGGADCGAGAAGGYRSSVVGEASGGGASAESTLSITPSTSYTVTVGAGGAGSTNNSATPGTIGSNSVFGSITSTGGGYGGSGFGDMNGGNGGSGGGGSTHAGTGIQRFGGSGTTGQGYGGGNGLTNNWPGGGGGGAGAVGANAAGNNTPDVASSGGNGGVGVSSSINGTATYRAGGGGGGGGDISTGLGGNGGGGAGDATGLRNVASGTVNTGGGGGGIWENPTAGSGGSGIVIIRYAGSQRGTGGTVTSSGGYTIHTFTSSSTYTG